VDIDLHNQLYPDSKIVPIPGFHYNLDLTSYTMAALFTIPNTVSDTEIQSTEDWCPESIYKPTIEIKHGKVFASDEGGLGCRLDREKFERFTVQRMAFTGI
jgi:L-alanine-DL-glutamate epimerase-like enolase superfamily enzyme